MQPASNELSAATSASLALAATLVAGACFEPVFEEGLACSELQKCPPGQLCDLSSGLCFGRDAPDGPILTAVFPPTTGWIDAAGAPIRAELAAASGGDAIFECRSGPASIIGAIDFAPCDSADGSAPFHVPIPHPETEEGSYELHARTRVDGAASRVTAYPFYVHRSLDGVATCPDQIADDDVFATASGSLASSGEFPQDIELDNPFIAIPFENVVVTPAMVGGSAGRWTADITNYRVELVSLRRRFAVDDSRQLVLVKRAFESRRERGQSDVHSCRNGYRFGGTNQGRSKVDCQYLVLNSRGQSVCLISDGSGLAPGPTSDLGWVKLAKPETFSAKGTDECPGCVPWYLRLPP